MTAPLRERLRDGLARTRAVLNTPVGDLVQGRRPLAAELLEGLEEGLIAADVGLPAATRLLDALRGRALPADAGAVYAALRGEVAALLAAPEWRPVAAQPLVVFAIGVNGVGKTTTLAKLASRFGADGRTVMLCAADTFRAAAAEQLEIWARRTAATFVRGGDGSDPSAVLTDALRSARARSCDVVLVDTAGRLHTRGNLMAELSKMARVAGREVSGAPHEVLLVLDASVGSNGLQQAREFAAASSVTGLVLTKLDGTAKGGIAVAVVEELRVPIRYLGVGEGVNDLLPFDAEAFAASLIEQPVAAEA